MVLKTCVKALDYSQHAFVSIEDEATLQMFLDAVDKCVNTENAYCAIDTETNGLVPKKNVMYGFSVSFGDLTFWVHVDQLEQYAPSIREQAVSALRTLMETPTVMCVFHHMKFDFGMIYNKFNIGLTPRYNDTLLMSRVLCEQMKHGLKIYINKLYPDLIKYEEVLKAYRKEYKKLNNGEELPYSEVPDKIMIPYACTDAFVTYHLFNVLKQKYEDLDEDSRQAEIYDMERRVQFAVTYLEQAGIIVDKLRLNEAAENFTTLRLERLQELMRYVKHCKTEEDMQTFLNSPKQKVDFFIKTLGLKPITYTATGSPSTDSMFFEHYKDTHPAVRAASEYLQYQFISNKLQEMIDNSIELDDNLLTVHTSYNQILETGRLSSTGVNLQNIPKRSLGAKMIRQCVVAPPDHTLVEIDYQAMELRLIATASQDPIMLEMLHAGKDVHSITAAEFFQRDLEFYKKPRSEDATHERDLAKNLGFGLCYGLGVKKLANMHKLPVSQASKFKEFYFHTYRGIDKYRSAVEHYAGQRRYVTTLCGRRRYLLPTEIYTKAVNTIIQGTGADVLKYALIDIFEWLSGYDTQYRATNVIYPVSNVPGVDIRLTVHDSLLVTVTTEQVLQLTANVIRTICDMMEKPRYTVENQVPLFVEISAGSDWADLKEIKV